MIKLLISLSKEKENIASLFDTKIIKYFSNITKPEKEDIIEFQKFKKMIFEVN